METLTNTVKRLFKFFHRFIAIVIKVFSLIAPLQNARTNAKLLVCDRLFVILMYEQLCVGPWVVRYLFYRLKLQNIEK